MHRAPNHSGQRKYAFCPQVGRVCIWVAKYHPDGDLRWWCVHRAVKLPPLRPFVTPVRRI